MGSGLSAGTPRNADGSIRAPPKLLAAHKPSAQQSARMLLKQLSFKVSGRTLHGTRCDLSDCDYEDVADFVEHADVDDERSSRRATRGCFDDASTRVFGDKLWQNPHPPFERP